MMIKKITSIPELEPVSFILMSESFRTELDSNRMEDMLWGFIMTEFFDKGSFSNIISS